MKVKIKKTREKAVIPKYAKPGDAGIDLTALDRDWETRFLLQILKILLLS